MPISRPFQVDPVLTAITIAYKNPANSLIADQLLPRRPVGGERFSWTERPSAENFLTPDTLIGRRGKVNRVEVSGIERSDAVNDYGLDNAIPVTDVKSAADMRARGLGNYNPVDAAAEQLTNIIAVGREIRVATLLQNPANYSPSRVRVLSGTSMFNDYANSHPIDTIKFGMMNTMMFPPNTMAMSSDVWTILSSHPDIVNAIKGNYTSRGIVSKDEFAKLFSIDNFLVGSALSVKAKLGLPGYTGGSLFDRVWGPNIILAYIDPQEQPESGLTFGMTAEYGTRIADQWFDKDAGGIEGCQVVRVGERVKELITAKDMGCLIQNCVAIPGVNA